MKKWYKIVFVWGLLLFCAFSMQAQKTYTIHVGNARLSMLLDTLQVRNSLVATRAQADTAFTQSMEAKIDSIKKRVAERKNFVSELKAVNASTLPAKFNKLAYESLNARLAQEATPLASDFEYARILESILAIAPKFRENKKAYFAEGKYEIPAHLKPLAQKVYSPIFDKIILLGNKFRENSFRAVIKTIGYSDGSYIDRSSTLYEDLAAKLQTRDLSDTEMHTYLSYLRAYDAAAVLNDLLGTKQKLIAEPGNMLVRFEQIGQGAQLPPQLTQVDALNKRRVVYVDWYILPKF